LKRRKFTNHEEKMKKKD